MAPEGAIIYWDDGDDRIPASTSRRRSLGFAHDRDAAGNKSSSVSITLH
jgi:hypothetical protein